MVGILMKIYDISMAINEKMTVYKNKESKKPKLINQSNFETSSAYETKLTMNLHTGTHIDAPLHMIENGNSINQYALETFVTTCTVLDLTHLNESIKADDLVDKNIKADDFILFKTQNSFNNTFNFEFIYLAESGAQYLKDLAIKGVGIDALGIERSQENHPTHKILLSNNIPIIEGLQLKDVPEGDYQLIALPIKIDNVEASPTRAILIQE